MVTFNGNKITCRGRHKAQDSCLCYISVPYHTNLRMFSSVTQIMVKQRTKTFSSKHSSPCEDENQGLVSPPLQQRDLMKITEVLSRKALWRLKSVSSTLSPLTWKNKPASWHQIWHNFVVMRQHTKAAAVASAWSPLMLASDIHWGVVGVTECRKIWNVKRNVWYLFRIF